MSRSVGKWRFLFVAAVLALIASGCNADWVQFGSTGANTRSTSDAGAAQSTLPTLAAFFTGATTGAVYSSPAIASGIAYVTSDDGKLYAFSTAGTTGCTGTPNTCTPLWTASIEPSGAIGASGTVSSSPAVVGNVVYVGSTNGKLEAFDATGTTNCSGSPKVCTPLWTGATGGSILSSPNVSGSIVFVGSTDGKLYAFDSAGSTGCSGSPKTCTPLWTGATGGAIDDSPAVSGTSVYIGSTDGKLYAFDSAGSTGCSGSPKTCTALWTGATGASITFSSPAVSGGSVFVGSTSGVLSVFDAAGSTGCSGSPKTCSRLWTTTTGGSIVSSPAVANNVVYVGSSDKKLYAIDATGATGCSGSPKVCTPLWTATTGGVIRSSPAVAGNTVLVGSDDHKLDIFDAAGSVSCSGSPKVCTPLWSTTTGAAVASSPSVAQGVVYVGSLDHNLYAFRPWVFTRPACPTNPNSGLSPCQIQDAYRLPSQVAGAGRTVAIVDAFDDPNVEADLAWYRASYGLPACTTANGCFKKLNQNGVQGSYPSGTSWEIEITLDLDAVSAACPLCHITLVEANDNNFGNLWTAEATAAAQTPAPAAISNSYGGAEFAGESSYDHYYNFPGIPVTVSTGDGGYGTAWPASAPNVTAVGGTVLAKDGSTRGWSETAWSGAGSGCSTQETAKPSYQHDSGCANRTIADVSALAGSPGLSIFDSGNGGWLDYGGTSLASPLVAATYALAYPDYSLATTYTKTASLFDITSGSTGSCSGSYLCTGVTGYDGPTGLGTPCGTGAFGSGLFTSSCPAPGSASPLTSAPAPDVVMTPACPAAPPGYARCSADKISYPAG